MSRGGRQGNEAHDNGGQAKLDGGAPHRRKETAQRAAQLFWERWRWVPEVLGLVAVLVGLGITFATLRTTKESVALTREQIHVGQRAYMVVERVEDTVGVEGKPLIIQTVIKNAGQTPATGLRIQSGVVIREHEPFTLSDVGFKEKGFVGGTDDLGAGQDRTIPVPFNQGVLLDRSTFGLLALSTLAQVPESMRPKAKIYLVMVIDYSDVFGGHDRTVACSYLAAGKFTVCNFLNELR